MTGNSRSFSVRRILATVSVMVILAGVIAYYHGLFRPFGMQPPANAIMVIEPYRHAGTWVFDDPAVGLRQEPFVAGIPEMIDQMVEGIPNAESGFRLLFSPRPFPGHTHKLTLSRSDQGGAWYYSEEHDKEGWLCPALFKYYHEAPEAIYVKAEPK